MHWGSSAKNGNMNAYVGEIDPEIVYGAVHIDLKNQD